MTTKLTAFPYSLPLRFKKFTQNLGLILLIFGKSVFPKFLTQLLFFRLTKIKLKFDRKKDNGDFVVCRYKYGAKGALCVSIDFDLLSSQFTEILRKATIEILRLAEKYHIHMSWGICCNLAINEPETYERVAESIVPHDLGAHTFTHIDLSSPACSKDLARNEILRCTNVLKRRRQPVTFIFPWNRVGHLNIVRELGFITFRGNRDAIMTYPFKKDDLWDIHKTYYLTEKSVNEVDVILRLIDFAIAYGCVLHIWTHPWNLAINGDVREFVGKVIDPLFEYVTQKRDEVLLWVCTMRELANYCEAKEACRIEHVERTRDKISFSVHCKIEDPRFDFPPEVTLRVSIPRKWKEVKVFVDSIEQEQALSFFTVKRIQKAYLYLTLSFEKPSRQVYLTKEDKHEF